MAGYAGGWAFAGNADERGWWGGGSKIRENLLTLYLNTPWKMFCLPTNNTLSSKFVCDHIKKNGSRNRPKDEDISYQGFLR